MRGIILDLCGGTGSWSQPYRDAGYTVEVIDPKELWPVSEGDVRLWPGRENDVRDYAGMVQGVLAAPPCTVFASSGARWERTDDDLREGLAVADACIRIVYAVRPKWWALENPIGRIVRWLGEPAFRFDPNDFGDPYTKRTSLWGDFQVPQKSPVYASEGSAMWSNYGGNTDATKTARSATPPGFAKAFQAANP